MRICKIKVLHNKKQYHTKDLLILTYFTFFGGVINLIYLLLYES